MDQVEHLISLAGDESYYPRADRILSLGRIGDRRAVEPLIWMLSNDKENFSVRKACIEALGYLGDDRAVPVLVYIAEQDDVLGIDSKGIRGFSKEEIRNEAVRALGKMYVENAIGKVGSAVAIKALIGLVESKNDVMEAAVQALGQIGNSRLFIAEALQKLSTNGNDLVIRFQLTRAACLQQGFPIIGIIRVSEEQPNWSSRGASEPKSSRVKAKV